MSTRGRVVAAALVGQCCHSGVVEPQGAGVRRWGVKAWHCSAVRLHATCNTSEQSQWNRTNFLKFINSRGEIVNRCTQTKIHCSLTLEQPTIRHLLKHTHTHTYTHTHAYTHTPKKTSMQTKTLTPESKCNITGSYNLSLVLKSRFHSKPKEFTNGYFVAYYLLAQSVAFEPVLMCTLCVSCLLNW